MGITVLVVDDSKLARIVVAKALAALQPDWAKVEAGNAEDALALMDASLTASGDAAGIDVALLDFNMPGRDGLELAAALRARKPDLPIAVITANVQDEIIARAHAIGAAFVPKPVTQDGLRPFLSGAALRLRTPAP